MPGAVSGATGNYQTKLKGMATRPILPDAIAADMKTDKCAFKQAEYKQSRSSQAVR